MAKSRVPGSSRRDVLMGTAAVAGAVASQRLFATPARAQSPTPVEITPALVEAAKKEGKVVWYTSVDLPVAERVGKAFEARYPGVSVRVERSGAERNFQRIGQEYASKIYACDTVNSSDAAHFIIWKRDELLEQCMPVDVAQHYPAEHKDAEGFYASWRVMLSVIAYNTKLVKAEDAPKSFADLLDPKWAGKMVKAHPGYSGTIMTATHQMSRDLGWEYFEKLAKQRIMQVQSAADPPKKIALGERAVMVDGGDYVVTLLMAKGDPVDMIYPTEGTPLITGPSAIMKRAPNPNAAKLFHCWGFTAEAQQVAVDVGGLRSAHAQVKDRAGRKPLSEIKTMKENAAEVVTMADEIKTKYTSYFKV